jgi:DNA-directed RNA polymerase subunit beta
LKSSNRINPYGSFSIRELDPPDLLEMQKDSFQWFLDEGLKEELKNISPIKGYGGRYELEFTGAYKLEQPKFSMENCLIKEITYCAPLNVTARLIDKETGEIKVQDVFIGDIPLMTDRATFIINGAERVVVSQLVRSSGVYFRTSKHLEREGKVSYYATIVPDRGSWLEFDVDSAGVIFARINRTKKIAVSKFLSAIGCTEKEINEAFIDNEFKRKTLKDSPIKSREESLLDIYRKLRPGDPVTQEGAQVYLNNLFFNSKRYDLGRVGRHKMNKKLGISVPESKRTLTKEDVLSSVRYLINLNKGEGMPDDIDHLGNRRIRSVGELLQRQVRIGLIRVERLIKEQMVIKSGEKVGPQQLINIRPIVAVIREFFGSSQLSQFMDQTNPLSELTHKRRLSALGPGGLTRERAGFEVRDIHPSHYGRICPIETPEGPNAGIIASLATYARVNKYGFIETPYYKVAKGKVTDKVEYMTADVEDFYKIGACDLKIDESKKIVETHIPVRYKREFAIVPTDEVDYIGVDPAQVFSITTALIPFLEHDDANRALMGANMQRQSVPLLNPEAPFVGTGLESQVARDSRILVTAKNSGTVTKVTCTEIVIKTDQGKSETYNLVKFQRSNQNTCLHQRSIVKVDDKVKKGEVIADGSTTDGGELALGKNVLVAFMPWEGYNFEDAILINERLVIDDVYTSVHIERFEVDVRTTKLGMEEITREMPNVSEDALRNLDERGIIRVGAEVKPGDILVGKVTPKGETELPAEEKLLRAIFGDKARDMRDTSLRVPPGEIGKVITVRVFSREEGDELSPGVHEIVRVYVAQHRKISIGDKIAGRHGNKGVIAKIMPTEDMPYMPDGTPIDIILNPLGVPSRMNVGQIFELLLGEAAYILGKHYEVPSFDESFKENASVHLVERELERAAIESGFHWLSKDGKIDLRDGRTGKPFDRKIVCGCMYIMKLIHLVDDKMHARSTGPYSLITQQPLGGKAQFGGQRFGEMEVWALEAYGAAQCLQELLTIKSDDVGGRAKIYESIIKGKPMTNPGTPESFKVLVKELRSLALDLKLITKDGKEVTLDEEIKSASKEGGRGKGFFSRSTNAREK